MSSKIIEVFNQYAVQLEDNKTEMFATKEEAQIALSAFENGAKNLRLASDYTRYIGISGKNAQGKINTITKFLTWVDAGAPLNLAQNIDTGEF